MPYIDMGPSRAEIFSYWKDSFRDIGIFIDWGEPSCWACGFHYGTKYDVKSADASWKTILGCWQKIPLQRCHIVPRSLGGSDGPSNRFLMCRECHDLQPNTPFPDIFFEWVRAQSHWRRESAKVEEALRCFGIGQDQHRKFNQVLESPQFEAWIDGKIGLHRPQSNYPSTSCRLTASTMVGLVAHYLRAKHFNGPIGPSPC